MLGAGKYDEALQLSRLIRPLVPPEQSLLLQAELHGAWGQALFERAGKGSGAKAESVRRKGASSSAWPAGTMRN